MPNDVPSNRLRALHLVWAVPVALLASAPLWLMAQFGWCGNNDRGCGTLSSSTVTIMFGLVLIGLLISGLIPGAILLAVPWTRKCRLRVAGALVAAAVPVVTGLLFIAYWAVT